jgi:hypothetical protein
VQVVTTIEYMSDTWAAGGVGGVSGARVSRAMDGEGLCGDFDLARGLAASFRPVRSGVRRGHATETMKHAALGGSALKVLRTT